MKKLPNSVIIRAKALKILAVQSNGLRPADLRNLTEQALQHSIPKDSSRRGSYRSAIWDLDKRFPQYVTKIELENHTLFVPTDQLIQDAENIEVPEQSKNKKESKVNTSSEEYLEYKHNLLRLFDTIDYLKLEKFLPTEEILKNIGFEEYKILTKVSMHIEGLRELKATYVFKDNGDNESIIQQKNYP